MRTVWSVEKKSVSGTLLPDLVQATFIVLGKLLNLSTPQFQI